MTEARPTPPAPDEASLHAKALAHLGRWATTRTGLLRVLRRAIDRWVAHARAGAVPPAEIEAAAAGARAIAVGVVARLAEAGAVDDAAFAAGRARRLLRSGRSRRAIAAHLAARGVTGEILRAALPGDEDAELAAALAYARRRRIGPFRAEAGTDERAVARELGMLARAGFRQGIARRALGMAPEEAAARITALLRG